VPDLPEGENDDRRTSALLCPRGKTTIVEQALCFARGSWILAKRLAGSQGLRELLRTRRGKSRTRLLLEVRVPGQYLFDIA
jgi:hypothetical protein